MVWRSFATKEKAWFVIFCFIAVIAILFIGGDIYSGQTKEAPAFGGVYVEAVSASPHNLNPILATNDADRDLSQLVFSSILKYDANGELVPDLANSYETSQDGKVYTIALKNNVRWHDGEPFGANDVAFTINAVQNPEYNSPLRNSWQGVKVETPDENTVILSLKTPYSAFIENLANLGIVPKHIWEKVAPQNFPLADFNLKPVGTGPYRFVKLQKDILGKIMSVNLTANTGYFGSTPFIKNIIFKFYASEEEAVSAFNRKEVDGLLLQTAQNKNQLRGLANSSIFSIPSLRVYGLFFNTNDKILGAQYVREAINYAIDREEILSKIFAGEGKVSAGPLPPSSPGSSPEIIGFSYNPQKTAEILKKNKWTKNEKGIYEKKLSGDKNATTLSFSIITTMSMQLAATIVQDYLKDAGIDAALEIVALGDLQQNYLRAKTYKTILIGESYTGSADPYVFWHGAAVKDPGLNLSLYNNIKVNKILEDARQVNDPLKRAQKLEEFQKLILNDAPAAFLYSPNYIYVVSDAIKKITVSNLMIPSNRFTNINEWYIETKRIWK